MNLHNLFILTSTLFSSSLVVANTESTPIQWSVEDGGNGHWYQLVNADGSWASAQQFASNVGGHLVTITSENERIFLFNLAKDATGNGRCWIGLYQNFNSPDFSEPFGGWEWITGESVTYTYWSEGEPNNLGGEHFAEGSTAAGWWNDQNNDDPHNFCIEWSDDCNGDGIVDYGQILNDEYSDENGNWIPDCCESAEVCDPGEVVQWTEADGGNGHWYQAVYVGTYLTWSEANEIATERGGYLATPVTANENDWIFNNITNHSSFWSCGYGPFIGGVQDVNAPDYSEPDGGWTWVSGETWSYENWTAGAPENCCGGQQHLMYGVGQSDPPSNEWNDVNSTDTNNCFTSYVIEWSADCNSDGIVDFGQLLNGELQDDNNNFIPDQCENPIQWNVEAGGNGHWYECVPHGSELSWSEAAEIAYTKGGYLATLSTEAENNWVRFGILNNTSYWTYDVNGGLNEGPYIGAFNHGKTWQWVDGSEWTYSNWHAGNPGEEGYPAYARFFNYSGSRAWQDNADLPGEPSSSFLIEYDEYPFCISDLNGDYIVDVNDILILLAWWGPCNDCDADIDSNSQVNVDDLLILIGDWGNCY